MTVTFLCCLQSTTKSSMNMFLVFAILFQLLFAVHSFADMWNITCADNGTVVTCCNNDRNDGICCNYYNEGNFCWDNSSAINHTDIYMRQRRMVNRLKNACKKA
ncbi:unnamed protein product [Heterobilharzia americana]|nr:unnamed protein product [Heterobilharzia americana]